MDPSPTPTAIKHAVFMRLRPGTPAARIDEVFADLAALKSKVSGFLDLSGGANTSTEGLSQGFTHGFVITFAAEAARDAYLVHPDHEALKAKIVALLEQGVTDAIVLDWRA